MIDITDITQAYIILKTDIQFFNKYHLNIGINFNDLLEY
jgi:hypothetical protein